MNHQHPNNKFTFEVEKNNNFSFLDIKICRENNKFTTSVFRKPTFSGVFTNFDSFIPISYKHGLVNTLKKNYQTVEKKQLLIILPFLGHLSFETRNRLNSCIRNQLPFCSLRIAFQSKTHLSSLFKFKESIPKYFRSHLASRIIVAAATQLIMVKLGDTFLYEHQSIWESLH